MEEDPPEAKLSEEKITKRITKRNPHITKGGFLELNLSSPSTSLELSQENQDTVLPQFTGGTTQKTKPSSKRLL